MLHSNLNARMRRKAARRAANRRARGEQKPLDKQLLF